MEQLRGNVAKRKRVRKTATGSLAITPNYPINQKNPPSAVLGYYVTLASQENLFHHYPAAAAATGRRWKMVSRPVLGQSWANYSLTCFTQMGVCPSVFGPSQLLLLLWGGWSMSVIPCAVWMGERLFLFEIGWLLDCVPLQTSILSGERTHGGEEETPRTWT